MSNSKSDVMVTLPPVTAETAALALEDSPVIVSEVVKSVADVRT